MASINKVFLLGNLGADPEIKTFDNGGKVAQFRIATTERWKDKNTGEKKESTDWHNIVVRQAALAGVVEQYVKKGSQVHIEGRIKNRQYEQNGEKKYITEIVADQITMLSRANNNASAEPNFGGAPISQVPTSGPVNATPIEDDLPF